MVTIIIVRMIFESCAPGLPILFLKTKNRTAKGTNRINVAGIIYKKKAHPSSTLTLCEMLVHTAPPNCMHVKIRFTTKFPTMKETGTAKRYLFIRYKKNNIELLFSFNRRFDECGKQRVRCERSRTKLRVKLRSKEKRMHIFR